MATINSKYNSSSFDQQDAMTAKAGFALATDLRSAGNLTHQADLAMVLISNESFSPAQVQAAIAMKGNLEASIEHFFTQNAKIGDQLVTAQQKKSVAYALMSAQNPRDNLRRVGNKEQYTSNGPLDTFLPQIGGLDVSALPPRSLEAYDTKPNDEMLQYTSAFALATATQNKFPELFYKTVHLSPDQYAVEMEIPLISVHEEVRYELEKRLTEFQRLNIVNAEIDHTILKNDTLKIVPIVRQQTLDMFVDPALVAPRAVVLESGESINTAPLKIAHRSSLFRAASTDAQLAKATLDQTDALDPGIKLNGVYILFTSADGSTKEVVRIDTKNSSGNQFTQAPQGATRLMLLNFVTDDASISSATNLFNGQPSTLLSAFQGPTANTAWLTFSVRGDIDLRDSSYEFIAGSVYANKVENNLKESLDLEDAANAAMAALFAGAKVIGLDFDVSKVNSNLRELGQLADFNTYRQVYGVTLGSPLAVQRPITNGDQQDALHAAALSFLCKARQSNVGITQLLSEIDTLRAYRKRNTNLIGRQPELMGISSYLVNPTLEEMEIDLEVEVTTTAQHQRNADIKAIMTDAITIMGYRMWQNSNWQAAANLLEGTEASGPVLKIGTDMVLTKYLMIDGDTRTAGPDFPYEKAWTMDARLKDTIILALGYPSANEGVPHPLDHGMMLNKPEIVAALNLSRGSHNRELIVHPTFRHIPLCPVLGVIKVKGLDKALSKKATLGVEVVNAGDFPV